MKKIKNSILVALLLTFAFQAQAQDKGTIRASGSLLYGQEVEEAGFNLGGEYFITDKISAAPSFTFFFVEGQGDLTQLNLDGRYYFFKKAIQIYALAGYASLRASADIGFGRVSVSNGGVNIGAGAVIPVGDRLGVNLQIKHSTPGSGQMAFQGGVVYRFK